MDRPTAARRRRTERWGLAARCPLAHRSMSDLSPHAAEFSPRGDDYDDDFDDDSKMTPHNN